MGVLVGIDYFLEAFPIIYKNLSHPFSDLGCTEVLSVEDLMQEPEAPDADGNGNELHGMTYEHEG